MNKSKKKSEDISSQVKIKTTFKVSMGSRKSNSQREVYSHTGLHQQIEKSQVNNLTYHLKELEKEEQENPKNQQKEENNKNQGEINKIEIKKQEKKSTEPRASALKE